MKEKFKGTDQKILEVSRRLFSQNGIVNIEMKDICKEIGCSRSTLYRHFASKEEILLELTSESVKKLMAAAIILPRNSFENGYEAFAWQVKAQNTFMMNNIDEIIFMRDFDYFYTKFIPETSKGVKFEKEMTSNRGREEMLKSLKRGIEDGSIKPIEDLDLMLYTVINSCIGLAQRVLPRESIYRNEMGYGKEMLEEHMNLLLESIRAR